MPAQDETENKDNASPALRRAAHEWRRTQKDLIGADGDTALKAHDRHRRASRKLAAVVDYDMARGPKS